MGMQMTGCLLVEFFIFLQALVLTLLGRKNGSFNKGKNDFCISFFFPIFYFLEVALEMKLGLCLSLSSKGEIVLHSHFSRPT